MTKQQNAGRAQWKLRRLAQRAPGVIGRHKASHAALRVLERTVVPLSTEFIALYDRVQVQGAQRGMSADKETTRATQLNMRTRTWLALLRRDVPSLVSSDINWHPGVSDDVIANARRVISLATQATDEAANLSYAAELIQDLNEGIEAAEAEWISARTESSLQGDQQARLRQLTELLQRDLVALRAALEATIGKGHADYQLLRNPRTRGTDDAHEDTPVANDNDTQGGEGEDGSTGNAASG